MNHELKRKNFTMIELIMVIAIIMLLAGLAVPQVAGKLDENRWKTAGVMTKNLRTAVEGYYMDKNQYPTKLEDLLQKNSFGNSYYPEEFIPKDPWNREYAYQTPGSGDRRFDIICYGADGVSGGEGASKDISCWDNLNQTDNK
ncbi:MAG: type II secretion system major pseudopilin GspG [Lentisphaeria bacterium]